MHSLGIYSWFGYVLPLEQRLKLIKKAGFEATCLWIAKGEQMVDEGLADQIPDIVRANNLMIDNIHAPYEHCNFLWSETKENKLIIVREYQEALAFCNRHNIPTAVMHLTDGPDPPPLTIDGIQIVRDLVLEAEELGVTIALENTRRTDFLDVIFSEIQSANLRFCYDSSHDFMSGQSKGKILERWGSLLSTVHLSDNHGINDDHLLPGNGTINWQRLGRSLCQNNFDGTLMLEVVSPDNMLTPEEFLSLAHTKLLQLKNNWIGGK